MSCSMRSMRIVAVLAATLVVGSAARAADDAAIDYVLASLALESPETYVAGRDALLARGEAVLPHLQQLEQGDSDWRLAAAAAACAGWLEHGEQYAEFTALEPRPDRGGSLRYVGVEADETLTPLLVEMLMWTEPDGPRRAAVVGLIQRTGDPRATPALGWALSHDDETGVRMAVITALERSKDPAATTALLDAIGGQADPNMRRMIAGALGWRKDAAAVPALVDLLARDEQATVRGAAAQSLGWIGEASAVSPLVTAISGDPDGKVRGQAALALGRLGGEEAERALQQTVDSDGDPEVVRLARTAMKRL